MTYIENFYWLSELENVKQFREETFELLEELSFATDIELALAYDLALSGEGREIFPLYMVTQEMRDRDLTFDQLEELLIHQYDT